MWDTTPWMIGGGARHSAEVGRLMAFASTSGAEGIVTPTDLKVTALPTPGGSVRVDSGGALLLNRYPGGSQQTYVGRNPVQHSVPISATTSAGPRTDMVIATVEDPQYAGQVPSNPAEHQYMHTRVIQGVPSNVRSAWELNLGYPAIALARIAVPASTSAITSGMITDLRQVAVPRSLRMTQTFQAVPDGQTETLDTTTWQWFPSGIAWDIPVPEWPSIHKVRADLTNVVNQNSDFDGWLRVFISGTEQGEGRVDIPWAGSTGRHNLIVAGQTPAGSEHAGQTVPVRLRARRQSGSGRLYLDANSQVIFDVEFTEAAV